MLKGHNILLHTHNKLFDKLKRITFLDEKMYAQDNEHNNTVNKLKLIVKNGQPQSEFGFLSFILLQFAYIHILKN